MTPPSRPGSASSPLAASERLWQWLFVACALVLGSFRLTHKNLWVDEAASAGFALGGPSAWVADHNMALYYMLLSAWVRVFGSSELALRAPSVLCFAACVPVLYAIARSSFGERSARSACALHVGNAFMLQFAQEARGYMLALLLVLCAQLALVRLLERPELRWSGLYGVSLGLATYAHLFAFWILLAHAVVLAPRWLRPSNTRSAGLVAFGLAALISAPVFVDVYIV
jgi:mannosyltransferase